MNLEKFAKDAGCIVILNPDSYGWGGKLQYHTIDCPNSHYCGYRTEASAYKGWLKNTFGERTSKAVLKLLKDK